jgi:predicted transcriptional regulator
LERFFFIYIFILLFYNLLKKKKNYNNRCIPINRKKQDLLKDLNEWLFEIKKTPETKKTINNNNKLLTNIYNAEIKNINTQNKRLAMLAFYSIKDFKNSEFSSIYKPLSK